MTSTDTQLPLSAYIALRLAGFELSESNEDEGFTGEVWLDVMGRDSFVFTFAGEDVCFYGERKGQDLTGGSVADLLALLDPGANTKWRSAPSWPEKGFSVGAEVPEEHTRGGMPLVVASATQATQDGRFMSTTLWCKCPRPIADDAQRGALYFENAMGGHGWGCCSCRRVVQTG